MIKIRDEQLLHNIISGILLRHDKSQNIVKKRSDQSVIPKKASIMP